MSAQLIAGRYQLLEAPKPGVLQRARDMQTAQTVVLRESAKLSAEVLKAALQQAAGVKGIFHPSLITLFDVTELPDSRLLLAYEYVPAQTIMQVTGGQPFNARRAAELVSEIADAVAELHARHVTHGNISSETVLVTMKGKAKLDRIADPALPASTNDPDVDLKAMVTLMRQLTKGGELPPGLEMILKFDDGAAMGEAAMLAASLRAAATKTS
jgi:serine/threonine protein kinase